MIELSDAIRIALNDAGEGMAIDEQHIIEKPYGWVLFPNTKGYIETGDIMQAKVGSGGTLVLRDDGRVIHFGSGFSVEENLVIFELGYLDHKNWDIVITKVLDEGEALAIVQKLGVTYIKPEVENGIEWKIAKSYSHRRMRQMLRSLPLRLSLGTIYFNYKRIESLKTQRAIIYYIEPNVGHTNPF